jgi:PAS domain S-box-containing protein
MKMKFRKDSLFHEIVTYYSLASLIIISLVSSMTYILVRDSQQKSVINRLEVAASIKQHELAQWDANQRQSVALLAQEPDLLIQVKYLIALNQSPKYQLAITKISRHFRKVIKLKPDIKKIDVLTPGGIIIFSTNKDQIGKYQPIGYNTTYFSPEWSDHAILNFYPDTEIGKSIITLAAPISDDKHRIAVLAVSFKLQAVDDIIRERSGLGESGDTYAISSIANSYTFLSGRKINNIDSSGDIHSFGIDAAMRGKNGSGLYKNYTGISVLGLYRWLPNQNLALLAEISQDEAFAPAKKLAIEILLICLGSAIVLIISVYLLARKISDPILAIADTATQVADGNLSAVVPVIAKNEVGTLAEIFNKMIKQLKVSQEERQYYSNHLEQKNKALQDSDRHLRLALSAANMEILDWNLLSNKAIESTNHEFVFGQDSNLLERSTPTFIERVHPEDREFVTQALMYTMEEGIDFNIEFRMLNSEARNYWMTAKGQVFYDEEGKPIQVLGAILNINERKLAEDALILNERKWRLLIQNSFDMIAIVGSDHIIRYLSPAIELILGCSSMEMIGRHYLEFVCSDDLPQVLNALTHLIQGTKRSVHFEYRCQHQDKSWRVLESAAYNLLDDPAISGIVIHSQDITDSKWIIKKFEKTFNIIE